MARAQTIRENQPTKGQAFYSRAISRVLLARSQTAELRRNCARLTYGQSGVVHHPLAWRCALLVLPNSRTTACKTAGPLGPSLLLASVCVRVCVGASLWDRILFRGDRDRRLRSRGRRRSRGWRRRFGFLFRAACQDEGEGQQGEGYDGEITCVFRSHEHRLALPAATVIPPVRRARAPSPSVQGASRRCDAVMAACSARPRSPQIRCAWAIHAQPTAPAAPLRSSPGAGDSARRRHLARTPPRRPPR